MSNARVMRWVTGGLELLLAIPFLGGLIVLSTVYVALGIMLVLHILTLIMSRDESEPVYGSVMGIVTSVLAWIPLLGWLLHLITAILLLVSATSRRGRYR